MRAARRRQEAAGLARLRHPVPEAGQRRFLLCLAARIVPESAGAPPQVTEPLLAAVDRELRPRPRLQQLEFKLLLLAIRWMTVPVTLRWFERLPAERQDRWLRFLETRRSPCCASASGA